MVHMNGNINQHIQSMHSIFMKLCVCGGGGGGGITNIESSYDSGNSHTMQPFPTWQGCSLAVGREYLVTIVTYIGSL